MSQLGDTALHYAVYYEGHLPMVEFLLEHAPQLIEMRNEVSTVWFVFELFTVCYILQLSSFWAPEGTTSNSGGR